MSDRLAELVRQRSLVLEHLSWLEREIASANTPESTSAAAPEVPALTTTPASPINAASLAGAAPATPAASGATSGDTSDGAVPLPPGAGLTPVPDVILDRYRVTTATVKRDVRKGCLLYFAGAFVVLGIVVAILYLTISSR